LKSKSIAKLIISEISAIGINLVPLSLWLFEDYSSETTMILYLLESVVAIILAISCVLLLAPARERAENKTLERNKIVLDFLLIAGLFAVALSVFVTAFIFLVLKAHIPASHVKFGLMCMAAFQIFEFASNLFLLRPLSLKQAEIFLSQSMGGLALLHISVFIGIFLALFVEDWFVLPFIIFRTLIDIATPIQFFMGKKTEAESIPDEATFENQAKF
jgi:hypothetical protein